MWHDSVCNTVQEPTVTSTIVAKKTTTWGESGFPSEFLEGLYGDSTESHAAELAHHFAEAEPMLGAERLVRYSLLAGEQALAAYAFEEALSQFQRGFGSGQDQLISVGSAALHFGLGRAQVALFRVEEARVSLSRAFEYYAESGDGPSVVRVAQSLPPGGVLLGMTSMTARALDFVDSDSLDEGRLLCRHGLDLGRTDVNYEAARAALQRALSIALREQDVALEMRTLSNIANVAGYNLKYQDSLGSALRAIELAHSGGDESVQS